MDVEQNQPAINFYILPDSDPQNRLFFVFRLVEKAFEQRLSTLIITADDEQLSAVERLLWTAKPSRFIPHDTLSGETVPTPILLTGNTSAARALQPAPQLMIDLSYDATPLNCRKIMLVANQHPDILPNARMKYQAYANQGLTPTVHKISERWLSV